MQQALQPSRFRKRAVAGTICKIALRTIPRLGAFSLTLLTVSFCFLFSAGNHVQQIWLEKNTPYELTATASNSGIDSDQLLSLEGVERVSPVLRFSAELEWKGDPFSAEVAAVHSGFLRLSLVQGVIYPDNSNMPYLVLNEAASKSLSQENRQLSAKDTVTLHVNGQSHTATVCGIFADESQTPAAYMSYDTARRLVGQGRDPKILLALSHAGAAPGVVRALGRYHLTADYDSRSSMTWELLQQQAVQSAVSGILLAVCAAKLMEERDRRLRQQRERETAVLQGAGMTSREAGRIYPMRIYLAEWGCLLAAAAIAMGSGIFSLLSAALCVVAGSGVFVFLLRNC